MIITGVSNLCFKVNKLWKHLYQTIFIRKRVMTDSISILLGAGFSAPIGYPGQTKKITKGTT